MNAKIEGEFVAVVIRDFGIGMPDHLLNDIFDMSKTVSRRGTDGEVGTGFGMPLMKKFVKAYSGILEISSKEKSSSSDDHGTQVKLRLKTGTGHGKE